MNIRHGIVAALTGLAAGSAMLATAATEPTVVELTQVGCQFLESENGVDHGYQPQSADDCRKINAENGDRRVAEAKVLELAPGKYIFRVANKNVPYELGFWVRGEGLAGRALLPSVSGGGLVKGATHDYEIELRAGEYLYSCPLNPTPDYKLVVK